MESGVPSGFLTRWEEKLLGQLDEMTAKDVIFGASCAFVREREQKLFYKGVQGAVKPYGGKAVEPGAYYDLASLTKVVGTASRIMQLVQEGVLTLDTPVSSILEQFRYPDITVGNLLLHNSGLPAEVAGKEGLTGENMLEFVYKTPPAAKRGEKFLYSDTGFILLGLVIQKVDEMTLEESFQTHIFGPLHMRDTSYLTDRARGDYIPTECTPARGCICGEVHDSKARLLGQSGSAGLFSTLVDLSVFVRHFLCRSEKLFDEETFRLFESVEVMGRTYGWSREYGSGTLYHTGFTGTSILMDTRRGEGFILLTNRIHPSRDNPEFLERRKELNDIFVSR